MEYLKYIAASFCSIGMLGAAIGISKIFGDLMNGISRNPSAADNMVKNAFIGAGLTEVMGLLSFVIAMLILFI